MIAMFNLKYQAKIFLKIIIINNSLINLIINKND